MNFNLLSLYLGLGTALLAIPGHSQTAAPTTTTTNNAANAEKEAMEIVVRRNREQNLRDFLSSRGVPEKPSQDALIIYVARQEENRLKVRQLGNKLLMALAAPAPTEVANLQIKKLTADYLQSLNDFQKQQDQDEKELEKQLNVSQNVRLQGVIMVLGLTSQTPPLLPSWNMPGTLASVTTRLNNIQRENGT